MVATFLSSIAGGMLAVLSLSPIASIANRFVRLIGIVAFAPAVGVGVWSLMRGTEAADGTPLLATVFILASAAAGAVIIGVAPFAASQGTLLRVVSALGGGCGIAAACLWSTLNPHPDHAHWLFALIGQLLASFLLGTVTVAWLLGHAYLTATKMTIAPLRHLTRMFSFAVGLRLAYFAACLILAYCGAWGEGQQWLAQKMAALWLVLTLRVAVGLVAVAVFAYMVNDCVKIRSTQSATGIMYFASVFVYVGELSSRHLMVELGIPL